MRPGSATRTPSTRDTRSHPEGGHASRSHTLTQHDRSDNPLWAPHYRGHESDSGRRLATAPLLLCGSSFVSPRRVYRSAFGSCQPLLQPTLQRALSVQLCSLVSICSLVVAPFKGESQTIVGAIGVIGPTRLNYARIIPMVDYTAKVIDRLIG